MRVKLTVCVCFLMITTACAVLLAPDCPAAADRDAQKIIDRVEKTVKKPSPCMLEGCAAPPMKTVLLLKSSKPFLR